MEVDNNCLSNLDENTEDNQLERSTPGSEQVTESGTTSEFSEVWNDFKCVFCSQDLKHTSNPKLLPCLHTACESCLTSEANSESSPSSSGTGEQMFTLGILLKCILLLNNDCLTIWQITYMW